MGAVCSCCAAEPAEVKETIQENSSNAPAAKSSITDPEAGATTVVSQAEIAEFKNRVEKGMDVVVLLADGTKLACQLRFNESDNSLIISCDTNKRVIPLSELKAILHGKEQLRRVETKASLVDDPNCVALHMLTGNCIPLRFDDKKDTACFIAEFGKIV